MLWDMCAIMLMVTVMLFNWCPLMCVKYIYRCAAPTIRLQRMLLYLTTLAASSVTVQLWLSNNTTPVG